MSPMDREPKSLTQPVRLTETVKKGGCAAKLPAGILRQVLGKLAFKPRPELLVGTENLDDAALWDLGDGRLLVQTLDFFTPIVDDPRDFGAIAAANAISDVYAMGGEPMTALTILAFPTQTLPLELLEPLMEGALEKIHESGACLAGGHTIDDETLKLGFSVTGQVSRAKAWTNSRAQPGDVLILTKGLGTGTITTALKIREAKEEWVSAAIASMKLLNRAPDLLRDVMVSAATDVTGFGLAGHLLQMMKASRTRAEIQLDSLPLIEGARECLLLEMLNRAHKTNEEYVREAVSYEGAEEWQKWLTVDPQTSGGLLLSVPDADAVRAVGLLRERFPLTQIVGRVLGWDSGRASDDSWIRFLG